MYMTPSCYGDSLRLLDDSVREQTHHFELVTPGTEHQYSIHH